MGMRIIWGVCLLPLALTAAPAMASPTYLKCTFPSSKGPWPVEITANEASSQVTLLMPKSGHSQRLAAAFSIDEVRFGNRDMSYVLSRTNLSITRTTPILNEIVRGDCQIAQPPKRAF